MECIIRPVEHRDFEEIHDIYKYYVENTVCSFEEVVPSVEEMLDRWQTRTELPYLVVKYDDKVAGYAYASRYHTRSAYRYTVENSIYIHPDFIGKGIGKKLMVALIKACQKAEFKQIIARIVRQENDSVHFHHKFDFFEKGVLERVGYKFGQWHNTVLMQCDLTTWKDWSE